MPKLLRCHAQYLVRFFVKATGGIEAGFGNGVSDGSLLRELFTQATGTMCCCVFMRGQAGVLSEQAVKVVRAHAGLRGQHFKRRWSVSALDVAAGVGNGRGVTSRERGLIGLAASAGTKAGGLRLFPCRVKTHVAGMGVAGTAGRPAVDAGAGHRIKEQAIGCRVARQYLCPARVAFGGVGLGGVADAGGHGTDAARDDGPIVAVGGLPGTPELAFESGNRRLAVLSIHN